VSDELDALIHEADAGHCAARALYEDLGEGLGRR
jgi:hypothetical protein